MIPRINASGLSFDTFVINASYVTISNLSLINGNPSFSADIRIGGGLVGTRIAFNYIGTVPGATNCTPGGVTRNGWSGIIISGNHDGSPGEASAYIYGNVIGCHPGHAIYIYNSDYAAVGVQPPPVTIPGGNWLGVSLTGEALSNNTGGIILEGNGATAAHNTIANNVISGNGGSGIAVRGAYYNTIRANKIGTNPAGTAALPNGGDGIDVYESGSHDNIIGGSTLADRNVISGNALCGVRLRDGSYNNRLDFNLIGLDAAGASAIPNGEAGVAVFNANDNTVGSSAAGVSQFLSGNTREGIYLENSSGTFIGPVNSIGVAVDGTTPRGNGLQGIMINGASNTTVFAGRVAYNRGAGIAVVGHTATGNEIGFLINRNNGGLPVDLGNDGFTPNGSRIPPGPNNWINYPVLTFAVGNVFIGTACAGCKVWVYQAVGNPATPGGGGSRLTQTVANGVGIWSATLPAGLTSRDVSLQACDSTENTSEMSPRPQLYLPAVLR